MLKSFIPTVYVQLSAERLTVRNPKTGMTVSEVPEIAIASGARPKVVAIGTEARRQQSLSVQVINPFAHPRTLMSDFTAGEQLLKAFLRRFRGGSLFAASPRVVLHLLGDPAGGFTQVEIRAFREMALGAGAAAVVVWQGRNLTDEELLTQEFPAGGQVFS